MCYIHTIVFCCANCRMGCRGHYMICKICNVFVPTCFESIEKHITEPKHGPYVLKHQFNNVMQHGSKFFDHLFH